MKKIVCFILIFLSFALMNLAENKEDEFAELNKEETIQKINDGYYWVWFKKERIKIQNRIEELCGFCDLKKVHEAQQHTAQCLEVIEELKYHYQILTGSEFSEIKRADDYYMLYEMKKDNTGYDLELFKKIPKEEFEDAMKKRKETIEYFTYHLNKRLKASKIGGVINKVEAYDKASIIAKAEHEIKDLTFYYEYFNKKKED